MLQEEATVPFLGLKADSDLEYPDAIETDDDGRFSHDAIPFEDAIEVLPKPTTVDVWAENTFVDENGAVDTSSIRDVHGFDVDALEKATGSSLSKLATAADSEPKVHDPGRKAVVDPRRLALNALGFSTRFRWQIASDRYTTGDPQDFLRPAIDAFQRRGNDAFGWISFGNWGGRVKVTAVWPSLSTDIEFGDDEEVTAYMGYRTEWDVQGTQQIKAQQLIFLPEYENILLPGIGTEYKRKHLGEFVNPNHERENDRIPPHQWHGQIVDAANRRVVTIPEQLTQARGTEFNLLEVPYCPVEDADSLSSEQAINTLATFYTLNGIPETYATAAAEKATKMANPRWKPTFFGIILSLQTTLLEIYKERTLASDQYAEYQELATAIYEQPFRMIQLAAQEYEITRDSSADEQWVPEEQITISNDPNDVTDIPGVSVPDERVLSDLQADRLKEQVESQIQETLEGFSGA